MAAPADIKKVFDDFATKYFQNLFVLMLAYVMVGCKVVASCPPDAKRTTEAVKVVEIPFDVAIRYYHRAESQSKKVQPQVALAWLEQRCVAERQCWVDKFRNSDYTLGEIILTTMERRDALWEVDENKSRESIREKRDMPRSSGNVDFEHTSVVAKKEGKALNTAELFKDNTPLCRNYNMSHCKFSMDKCPLGKHVCNGVQGNQRICGGTHPSDRCTNPKVPKKE